MKLVRAGSTTQVWEAMNSTDNERVALKALQRDYRTNKEQIAMLRHEFQVGRNFSHENVNSIHDFSIDRGVPYIVMDYCSGVNLKQAMRLATEQLVNDLEPIIMQSARGLQHMHEQGWVHRDVKPDNFLLDENSHIKLIDFAIAQKIKTGFGRFFSGRGKVQGTRSYMSPEQIRGEAIDARADIYSLGCMIFELLSGKLPYTGTSANDLLTKHVRAPIPALGAFCDSATPEFAKLVADMMAKKPEHRPESLAQWFEKVAAIRMFKWKQPPSGN